MKPYLTAFASLILMIAAPSHAAELRIGMIGLDTSHAIAFTQLLNDPKNKQFIPGGKVVVAFKGGSPDIESSWSRVEAYTRQLETEFQVKIVPSIEELCAQVDAVMIESVDGRPHLEQARAVFKAHKPVFIDKPIAGTLRDAIEIFRLAKENNVPCFTASAYRYYDEMTALLKTDVGRIRSAISYGPSEKEPHHPDFFWSASIPPKPSSPSSEPDVRAWFVPPRLRPMWSLAFGQTDGPAPWSACAPVPRPTKSRFLGARESPSKKTAETMRRSSARS